MIIALFVMLTVGDLNAQTTIWLPSPGHTQISIWPGTAPDAGTQPVTGPEDVTNETTETGIRWICAHNVTQPTMTVYSPGGTNTCGIGDNPQNINWRESQD